MGITAKTYLPQMLRSNRLKALVLLIALLASMIVGVVPYQRAQGAGEKMMAFWDPSFGAVPANWTVVTTFNGRFPRGESVANYGLTGANDVPRSPTVASVSIGPANTVISTPGSGTFGSLQTHTHASPSVSAGTASNGSIAAFRSLQLIEFTPGIPTFIPAGVIIMFDPNGAIPSGFTRLSAHDNRLLRIDSTVVNGGNDQVNYPITVSGMGNSSETTESKTANNAIAAAAVVHTHSTGVAASNPLTTAIPPYVQPLLARADQATVTLPAAMVAMFNGDPGVGWQVVSNVGGAYHQQFLRPSATASLVSQGSATHTPASIVTTSGPVNTASPYQARAQGNTTGPATQAHTHQVTISFNPVSNLPPYFNVVIAQKVSFTLMNYRWFADSNNQNVTDAWPAGTLDIAQNTAVPTVPAQYVPPDINGQLRLRMQALVSGQALPAGTLQFKMQFKQGTDGSCTTGTWTDVGSSAQWGYGTNTVATNSTLTASQITPVSSVLQLFFKVAPSGTNPNAVATGQSTEYDTFIRNQSAASATQYSFRIVESTGNPLSVYAVCPTLITRPSSQQVMRHGNFFRDGTEGGFLWVD